MPSSAQHIVTAIADWLGDGTAVWLGTVLETWGSSPRPVGAMMACTENGERVGSLSGGCIEEDFLGQLRDGSLLSEYRRRGRPWVVQYGATAEEQARLRLPCGGRLHVLLEYLEVSAGHREPFRQLAAALDNRQPAWRVVDLATGAIRASSIAPVELPSVTDTGHGESAAVIGIGSGETVSVTDTDRGETAPATGIGPGESAAVTDTGHGETASVTGIGQGESAAVTDTDHGETAPATGIGRGDTAWVAGDTMIHRLSPTHRLLLLGAGEVSRHVAELAPALGYEVTLCDPRPGYLDSGTPADVELTSRLPDDVVLAGFGNPYSAVIALAHDPRVDDMALMAALKTEAFYIGAMGSARTSAARRERLSQLGLTAAEIARLRAPIGYAIGSKTPAEIAIAILAELTAVRNGVVGLARARPKARPVPVAGPAATAARPRPRPR